MVSVNAIQGTLIADNAITAVHIATNAVSGTLIADNAVTAVHIAQNSITVTQLADDCVESDKIADGIITTNHLNKAMISSQTEVAVATGDYVLLGDTSDSNNLKKAPISSILAGTLTTAAQTNITSVGTLTSFRSTGIDDNADALAITIDSSENVGIGITPSANNRMTISEANGTAYSSYAQLRITGGTTNNNRAAILFTDSALSDGKISYYPHATAASRLFSISARGTESDFVIKGDGKVGIGNTGPSYALDIDPGSSSAFRILNATNDQDVNCTITNSGTGTGSDSLFDLTTAAGAGDPIIRWSIAGNENYQMGIDNSDSDKLKISQGTALGTNDRIVIHGGNVGIGTAAPSAACHIYTAGAGAINLGIQNSERYWKMQTDGGDLTFNDVTAGDLARMTINTTGYVGMGVAPTTDQRLTLAEADGNGSHLKMNNSRSGGGYWITGVGDTNSSSSITPAGGLFFYNGATRMVIDNGGKVGIGTTSPAANLHVSGANPNNSSDAILYVSKTGGNDFTCWLGSGADDHGLGIRGVGSYAWAVYDHNAGAYRARLQFGGDLYLQNTTINSISDRRLKKNIVDANSQWNDIKALKWRNFEWKDEYIDGTYLGLIADEVESISPNLVEINAQPKEDIDAGIEDPKHKAVKYSIVWMKAMKALQEAQTRIETLEAKVATLEG